MHFFPSFPRSNSICNKRQNIYFQPNFFFMLSYLFIYLFLAVLGLHFCVRALSSCGERGPLFIAVHGPLTITASLVAEHRLQTHRLSTNLIINAISYKIILKTKMILLLNLGLAVISSGRQSPHTFLLYIAFVIWRR